MFGPMALVWPSYWEQFFPFSYLAMVNVGVDHMERSKPHFYVLVKIELWLWLWLWQESFRDFLLFHQIGSGICSVTSEI
jgi:hypothetical protein